MLAVGRDYTDVAPIGGVVFGSGRQKLNVEVDVIPMPEEPPRKGPAVPPA